MIIKGNPAGSVGFWAKHLLRDDTNETAEVKEITGLLAQDLHGALREMEAIGAQSRCHGNFMYQANINPRDDEHLTPEQWKEAVDTLEKNLGLDGHQRVVVEHVKNGRQHVHVIWNRVDVDTLRVTDMGGNWPIHEKTARELEKRFGLSTTPTPEPSQAKKPAPELWEARAAERSGIDPKALTAELTGLWRATDSGRAFAAAIEERGYILAKGDRRDFCIVDQAGDAHSLARRLDGVNTKAVRERMGDIDRDALPNVAEARETQRQKPPLAREIAPAERIEPRTEPARPERTTEPKPSIAENDAFWKDRRERKDAASEVAQERWLAKAELERARIDPVKPEEAMAKKPALMVIGLAGGIADTLVSFVGTLGKRATDEPQDRQVADQLAQIKEQRRARAALERIRDGMERGEWLRADDIRCLTPTQIDNLRVRGDDYIRSLIDGLNRERTREDEYGRTRER